MSGRQANSRKLTALLAAAIALGTPVGGFAADATCGPVAQSIQNIEASVAPLSTQYWGHHANFLALSRNNAVQPAAQGTTQGQTQTPESVDAKAAPIRTAMQNTLANLRDLIATARANNCLTPAQLLDAEAAFKAAKHVSIDRFVKTTEAPGQGAGAPPPQPQTKSSKSN